MISVGSIDTRKGLGLGFVGKGGDMEENELEEGDACSYHNNDDYDSSNDPDVALSYIDEKLQNVLGHLQKDFEGGVSAENLGAKFGGYGSFLPMYQRSPVWSHPKSPPKVQTHPTYRSPKNLHLEGGRPSCSASPVGPQLPRSGPSKASASKDSERPKKCARSTYNETSNPGQEAGDKKFSNLSDQKFCRVQIKVGLNDLPKRKKISIYSGIGFDFSPSSSLENSPSENEEGIYCESHDDQCESPSRIIMAMASFTVHGNLLLSPLSDDLIHLTEKLEIVKENNKSVSVTKFDHVASHNLVNGSSSRKSDEKVPKEKKGKTKEGVNYSIESSSLNKRNFKDINVAVKRKEIETDILSCEELVSKTLKLPLLSCSSPNATDTSDTSREAFKGVVRGKIVEDVNREPVDLIHSKGPEIKENPVASTTRRVRGDEDTSSQLNDDQCPGGESSNSIKSQSHVSKGKKVLKVELVVSPKQKGTKIDAGHEQEGTKSKVMGGQKKSKGCQSSRDESAGVSKTKKSADVDNYATKRESENFNSQKDATEDGNRYKASFGDVGESEEENQLIPLESKDSDETLKRAAVYDASKERLSNKKSNKFSTSKAHHMALSEIAPPSTSRPVPDVAHATTSSVIIEDHRISCYKCDQWHFLPIGMNPDDLPDNWDCSMLSWLPGMNHCTIHQDETTKAVFAMYQAHASEGQRIMHANAPGVKSQVNGENLEKLSSHAMPGVGKKIKGLKEMANATDEEGKVNYSPLASELHLKQVSKSSVLDADRQKVKRKEKPKALNKHSDGGDTKNLKSRSKRDPDQELSRLSKKKMTESLQFSDLDRPRYNGHPKDLLSDKTDGSQNSGKKQEDDLKIFVYNGYDNRDAARKRKLEESQEIGDHLQDGLGNKKKPKVSRSGEKESHANRCNGKSDRKGGQDWKNSKRDSLQPSGAATSSSSKISGSHKTKTIFYEVNVSPVESVSSSPLRMSDPDKLTSARWNFSEKDEPDDTDGATTCSRRGLHGEDYEGSDRSGTMRKGKILIQVKDFSNLPGGRTKEHIPPSPGLADHHFENGKVDDLGENTYYYRRSTIDLSRGKDRKYDNNCYRDKSQPKNLGKGSSSQSKEKSHVTKSVSIKEVQDNAIPCEIKPKDDRSKKEYVGKASRESSKKDLRGHQNPNVKLDGNGIQDFASAGEQNIPKIIPVKADHVEMVPEKGKKKSLPPYGAAQVENLAQGGDGSKAIKQIRRNENHDVMQKTGSRDPTQSGHHRLKDRDASSPLKKESTCQAASNALKEATDLKHMADRLKNSGSNLESTGFYFQAALKFLRGASLLESFGTEKAKHGDMARSMDIYGSTAKLCEFCAQEYEKFKDMAAAALAYKCMEVAYMRVVYSSHGSVNRYRLELQVALQVVPPGESPSSSASDADNLKHPMAAVKVASSKGVRSPQVTGSYVVSKQNHSDVLRMLKFSQDVYFAMDASRKARIAFSAANTNLGDVQYDKEGNSSIKRALDFNFRDIEGLLRLVRLAMEAINR